MQKLKGSEDMKKEKKNSISRIKCSKKTHRFYRHLGTKAIEVTAHPSMKEVEHYWQSICEVEA
jgi:hypothetical protein